METVDLGVCQALLHMGPDRRSAIVLPGASYSIDAPLLWFARQVLAADGRSVLAIQDRYSGDVAPHEWVEARAMAALDHLGMPDDCLIVGKSISTRAAPLAAERRMAAIWLTPLLHVDRWPGAAAVINGLRAATAPALVVGGTADDAWNGDIVHAMAHLEVVEVPDADHVLQVPDDPLRSVEALRAVVVGMQRFMDGLTAP